MIQQLLAPAEAARLLGVSVRSLERMRVAGDGPPFVRIGKRRVAYTAGCMEAWLASRTFDHRAAEMARRAKGGL
ncbi:helix-turn-helix domain-containing protein [Sediminicoccus sp. KRV36]|uniref:helix-turn-helix transcriptional regulator n=1 Tax=Sediminicoccus sp. KRV36 TaxID=3133721 RepID=UPI00200F4F40|nr:helix-turn-helix domain-containing protein [Sediminicoccus rosea]UPY35430.1 helix-turn-helix domain-containing protein [Sediminicoccus rosea]